ncbi:hypothetical protein, partial [Nocardia sp. NPDC003345]
MRSRSTVSVAAAADGAAPQIQAGPRGGQHKPWACPFGPTLQPIRIRHSPEPGHPPGAEFSEAHKGFGPRLLSALEAMRRSR